MSNYKYSSEYEREETQKYEGTYTPEQIELNKKLYEVVSKEHIDFYAAEELLKQGADPLGGTEVYGWELVDHIYGDIVGGSQDYNSVELPQLTELFLKYGMDVDNPKIPYDYSASTNPMWQFAFVTNENAIYALKMLLDKGLSEESFGAFWGHCIDDFFLIDCVNPHEEHWNYECTWSFKMLLLGASYDHILDNDEALRELICYDYNNYDVHKFRNWDNYKYIFDTSHCDYSPELYKSILYIYDKETGEEVWKMGLGNAGRQVLAELCNK